MKALFIGGIRSGKSFLAEEYAIKYAKKKPIYLATTELLDEGMQERIEQHKKQRADKFVTLEEPLHLVQIVSKCEDIVLIECVSMWLNNMLYHGFEYEDIKKEIQVILKDNQDKVFVINDVGSGIIPDNALARKFADISGKIAQLIASECDEVFHVIAGIGSKIK